MFHSSLLDTYLFIVSVLSSRRRRRRGGRASRPTTAVGAGVTATTYNPNTIATT